MFRENVQRGSTAEMMEASAICEEEYDKLLNKYYNLLRRTLDDEGKAALKASQLKWLAFLESEKELVSKSYSYVYNNNGGGTMWGVVFSDFIANTIRDRVNELYSYYITVASN